MAAAVGRIERIVIAAVRMAGRGDATTTGRHGLLRHLVVMERTATTADDEVGRDPHMAATDAPQVRTTMVMMIFHYHDAILLKCRTYKSLPKMTLIGKLPQLGFTVKRRN